MPAEIPICSALCIEIISYTPRNSVLVGAIGFATSPLEGGVAIGIAVLTHIARKLSAAFRWYLEIRLQRRNERYRRLN